MTRAKLDRQERLAAALRDNLKRRKQRAKSLESPDDQAPESGEAAPGRTQNPQNVGRNPAPKHQ
jgi:hypothetical protein